MCDSFHVATSNVCGCFVSVLSDSVAKCSSKRGGHDARLMQRWLKVSATKQFCS